MRHLLGFTVLAFATLSMTTKKMNSEIFGAAECTTLWGYHYCDPVPCNGNFVNQTTSNPDGSTEKRVIGHPAQGPNCSSFTFLNPGGLPVQCDQWAGADMDGCNWGSGGL